MSISGRYFPTLDAHLKGTQYVSLIVLYAEQETEALQIPWQLDNFV